MFQRLENSSGIVMFYLPPCSPDLNPIEELFSFVNYYLKRHDELLQAIDDPAPIIQAALDTRTDSLKYGETVLPFWTMRRTLPWTGF